MNDYDIDRLVVGAAPATGATNSPSLAPAMADLREQIMQTDLQEAAVDTSVSPARTRRQPARRLRFAVAAAAAAVVAVVALVVGVGDEPSSAYAAEIVAVAEGAPRLLIDADGWSVTRADEFSAGQGEMTFENSTDSASLHWRPADTHAGFVSDREAGAEMADRVEIAGDTADLFRYSGTDSYTALWLRGDHSLEFRIDGTSEESFREAAGALTAVDVDAWLDALPDSVVRPADRSEAVSEMLTGLPIPDSFDRAALDGSQTADRYQLGAQVSGAVACGWLDQWAEANRVGDESSKAEAEQALATSTSWPVLLDMNAEGDYPEVVWELSAAVNGGDIGLPSGVEIVEYGPEIVSNGGYVQGLGCDLKR